ncbi:MAG: UDP-N-acetylmuramoyl-L-alanyl-D-glutamate--2,6-diaminopimelate ligase [Clostridiales bacterium]|nr:UDP-N-acetylmuramoyl-L-alanyl-D-glutamate--2,6-diaminopimelate ligase [Clostridiales bacterium]
MKLEKLVKNVKKIKVIGDLDIEILNVQIDSNSLTKGSLFICLKGGDNDGHEYVKQAEKYGAVALVCEREVESNLTQIVVEDTRLALSIIAKEFYECVSDKMKLIGVVGTNGKTTTAHLIGSVLNGAGIKCGVIGTLGTFYGDYFLEPNLTTPDPLILHKTLSKMFKAGYETVVMEVSAHAIHFQKLGGVKFEVGVFTNFSRDHLDFFKDMQNYEQAKLKFFKENDCKFLVVNADDELGQKIAKNKGVITYGINNPSDVFAIDVSATPSGQNFIINLFDCVYNVDLNLSGKFNVYNSLACATTCALLGVSTQKIIEELNRAVGASGRFERVYNGDFSVIVDYAHTPDGLLNLLSSVKESAKSKIICVFGCGGNRDVGKRYEMGKISGELADFTVITSDNPRYEEPMAIISQVEQGVLEKTNKYVIVQDRAQAIEYALDYAKSNDVVIVAGKGSENYQEILGIKRPYNDKDTIIDILRRKRVL